MPITCEICICFIYLLFQKQQERKNAPSNVVFPVNISAPMRTKKERKTACIALNILSFLPGNDRERAVDMKKARGDLFLIRKSITVITVFEPSNKTTRTGILFVTLAHFGTKIILGTVK